MIKIVAVTIRNFRAFGEEIRFDFCNKSLVLFSAPNGVGKTSLLDAIEWGLTGNIERLDVTYKSRNTGSEKKLKANQETILKNKYFLHDNVKVILEVEKDGKVYQIIREQDDDTLENPGDVMVKDLFGNVEEDFLNKLIDVKNFYKYHVCDMQKTYRFLSHGRDAVNNDFVDFTTNYDEAECVEKNLAFYRESIKKRINDIEKRKVQESVIKELQEQLQKKEKMSEILPYEMKKIYSDEKVDLSILTTDELKSQLLKIKGIGYKKVVALIERKRSSLHAVEVWNDLKLIEQKYATNIGEIEETIKFNADNPKVIELADNDLKKKKQLKLSINNMAANSEEIISYNSLHFTKEIWEKGKEEVDKTNKILQELKREIEVLNQGNEILEILTAIAVGKEALVAYREEQKKENDIVLCPVCGSERFGELDENEIVKQAQGYQAEHKELIEQKKNNLKDLEKKKLELEKQLFEKAEKAHKEAVTVAQDKVNQLTKLYNQTKDYFSLLKKLEDIDKDKYSREKMLSTVEFNAISANVKNMILTQEEYSSIEREIGDVLEILGDFYDKNKSLEQILSEIKPQAEYAPEDAQYDEELVKRKIISILSYMKQTEMQDLSAVIKKNLDKNANCEGKIKELQVLFEKAKKRENDIAESLRRLREDEFQQVAEYLYRLFKKLSRDIKIDAINLISAKGKKLSIADENGKSIMNMFSDGQLSVFMLSYFLGNAWRIRNNNPFPVYLIDDITSCMDDINMLAFLDFIKYQLSDKEGAFNQLFFATCDSKIQELLCWKMDSYGIEYCLISANDFELAHQL